MEKELQSIINEIKNHKKYNSSYDGKFPIIKSNSKYQHFPVITEQIEKIIGNNNLIKYGLVDYKDRDKLTHDFFVDINLFLTENKINLKGYNPTWSQQLITSNALYHIACSKTLPHSYKTTDLLMNPVNYEAFSTPFIIRLAIENKLKAMIGFISCDIITRDKKIIKNTNNMPFTKIVKFLSSANLLNSPCSFEDIENIYNWSCNFTHTGKREYIWIKLKALESLHDLFDYNSNRKYEILTQDGRKLSYLKNHITINELMTKINENDHFKNSHKLTLSENGFDENYSFYDKEKCKYL